MLGAATSKDGLVTITDMDTIERSNLSRQFLFRPADIDKAKSEVFVCSLSWCVANVMWQAARRAMLEMNKDMNIKCFIDPVSESAAAEIDAVWHSCYFWV